jgi:hypothetical protein
MISAALVALLMASPLVAQEGPLGNWGVTSALTGKYRVHISSNLQSDIAPVGGKIQDKIQADNPDVFAKGSRITVMVAYWTILCEKKGVTDAIVVDGKSFDGLLMGINEVPPRTGSDYKYVATFRAVLLSLPEGKRKRRKDDKFSRTGFGPFDVKLNKDDKKFPIATSFVFITASRKFEAGTIVVADGHEFTEHNFGAVDIGKAILKKVPFAKETAQATGHYSYGGYKEVNAWTFSEASVSFFDELMAHDEYFEGAKVPDDIKVDEEMVDSYFWRKKVGSIPAASIPSGESKVEAMVKYYSPMGAEPGLSYGWAVWHVFALTFTDKPQLHVMGDPGRYEVGKTTPYEAATVANKEVYKAKYEWKLKDPKDMSFEFKGRTKGSRVKIKLLQGPAPASVHTPFIITSEGENGKADNEFLLSIEEKLTLRAKVHYVGKKVPDNWKKIEKMLNRTWNQACINFKFDVVGAFIPMGVGWLGPCPFDPKPGRPAGTLNMDGINALTAIATADPTCTHVFVLMDPMSDLVTLNLPGFPKDYVEVFGSSTNGDGVAMFVTRNKDLGECVNNLVGTNVGGLPSLLNQSWQVKNAWEKGVDACVVNSPKHPKIGMRRMIMYRPAKYGRISRPEFLKAYPTAKGLVGAGKGF